VWYNRGINQTTTKERKIEMYASFNGKRVTVFNDNGSPHTNIRTRHPAVQVSVSGNTVVVVNEKGDTEIFGTNGAPIRYSRGR
jgi:hypothetical protein